VGATRVELRRMIVNAMERKAPSFLTSGTERNGSERVADAYGSEGWGFESLRARSKDAGHGHAAPISRRWLCRRENR
jgi:hypothetical protein